jgi:hypothetical protein
MLSIRQDQEENQNVAQAPTLGRTTGSISQGGGTGQKRNVSQRGSGFTNLQQYVTANENNANPELVRQRTAQAGTGLEQAEAGFKNVATQAQSGLQGIQGVNTFVGNVLRDPTAAAANQETLKRFQALRTGQEAIKNLNEVYQPFTQAQAGFGSQREQLASGLRTDTTGSGLQDYIRSQRANPSLATQGENVLDRFLTESTTAGKTAIQQAQERAGQIQATQIPGISGEVEVLRQQVEPLQFRTKEAIQTGINPLAKEQENFLTGLNNNVYLARQLGINNVEEAQNLKKQADEISQNMNQFERNIDSGVKALQDLRNQRGMYFDQDTSSSANELREKIKEREAAVNRDLEIRDSQRKFFINNKPILDKIDAYNQRTKRSRQELLQEYDPNRLAKINALSQLSGQSFQDLLNRGI